MASLGCTEWENSVWLSDYATCFWRSIRRVLAAERRQQQRAGDHRGRLGNGVKKGIVGRAVIATEEASARAGDRDGCPTRIPGHITVAVFRKHILPACGDWPQSQPALRISFYYFPSYYVSSCLSVC